MAHRAYWISWPWCALLACLLPMTLCCSAQQVPQPAASPAVWNLPGKAPHLLSHYMPWFQVTRSATDPTRVWEMWSWKGPRANHDPEHRRPNGERDIASIYYPLIGVYNTWSRDVVRYHLKTAQAAGIQGFILDWYGPGSYTDQQVPLLLDEAQRLGMRIAICYEEKINFQYRKPHKRADALATAVSDLRYIVDHYGTHPAYLKRNGVPLIIQFNGYGNGPLGPGTFSPEEWRTIFAQLPHPPVYARQGQDSRYHPPLDGGFSWWVFDVDEDRNFGTQARRKIDAGQLGFFLSMVCPGFDDTGVWGWNSSPRVTPRHGLSVLRSTFEHAFDGNPELIQIVTWNDFTEGTVVEPTVENGFQYLDALATWWGEKTGKPANLAAIRQPFLEYTRTCSPAERAELPPPPYDRYLQERSLAVEIPHYLDQNPPPVLLQK